MTEDTILSTGGGRKGLKTPFVYQCFCAPSSKTKHVTALGVCAVQASLFSSSRQLPGPRTFHPKADSFTYDQNIYLLSKEEIYTSHDHTHRAHMPHPHVMQCGEHLRHFWYLFIVSQRRIDLVYRSLYHSNTHPGFRKNPPFILFFSLALLRESWQVNIVNAYTIECDALMVHILWNITIKPISISLIQQGYSCDCAPWQL